MQNMTTVADNGTDSKRAYNRTPRLQFDNPVEILALYKLLDGDKTVHGAWRSQLLQKIEPFLPAMPDLSQPPR